MTAVNITEEIYFGFREEADRRGYHYNDGKVDTPRLINETLRKKLFDLQKEVCA